MDKKVWIIASDNHGSDNMEYLVASTEEKAEELMREVLDVNYHGKEPNEFHDQYDQTVEECVKKHEWGNGFGDEVRIIEAEIDSPYFVR